MIYIDSNIFLYPLIYDESLEKAKQSKGVLSRILKGEIKACSSSLTWDEVVYIVGKVSGFEDAREVGRRFLIFPNLKILGVDKKTIDHAQDLMEQYQLKPRDAIHAASALNNGVKEIVSEDNDFDGVEGLRRIRLEEI